MKLTKPLYTYTKKGFKINYKFEPKDYGTALNCLGMSWLDDKYKLLKTLMITGRHTVILTDSDLIGRNDYIDHMSIHEIVLVITNTPLSPSKKRMQNAYDRIKSSGHKVRLFHTTEMALLYIQKKGTKK